MKAEHPITIDRVRSKAVAGGDWHNIDSLGKGRVQVLPAGGNVMTQAVAVMTELQRLFAQAPDRDWAGTAVIAREWKYLEPVRSYCELKHIPVQMADEEAPHFWRLRETQALVKMAARRRCWWTLAASRWLARQRAGPWWSLLRRRSEYALQTGGAELPISHFIVAR